MRRRGTLAVALTVAVGALAVLLLASSGGGDIDPAREDAVAASPASPSGGGAARKRLRGSVEGERAGREKPSGPPNVIVIMTDDQRDDDMRAMPKTRRLLGEEGVRFRRSFVSFPLCCPARASLLTGQYAHNHGVRDNVPPAGGFEGYDDSGSLPVALSQAGYRTGFIGKYLNRYPKVGLQRPEEIPAGWDVWHGQLDGHLYDWRLNSNGRIRHFAARPRDYQTDVYSRLAQRFIGDGAEREEPFFLTVVPFAPHLEHVDGERIDPRPAPRHRGAFAEEPLPLSPAFNDLDLSGKPPQILRQARLFPGERRELLERHRSRLASLLAVDDLVADVVERLDEAGELDRTLLFYTSDNGYYLGEHRLIRKGHLYDPAVRVPLLVRGPGFPAGAVRRQPVLNIDIAPTIMAATGTPELTTADGIDLRPLARRPRLRRQRAVLLENRTSRGVRTPDWLYIEHGLDRDDDEADAYELYDLEADPHQRRNLLRPRGGDVAPRLQAPHRARIAAARERLAARLLSLGECSGDGCRRP